MVKPATKKPRGKVEDSRLALKRLNPLSSSKPGSQVKTVS